MAFVMMVVLDIPPEQADEILEQYDGMVGDLHHVPGLLSWELLKPADGTHRWITSLRFEDRQSFDTYIAATGHGGHDHDGDGYDTHTHDHGDHEHTGPPMWTFDTARGGTAPVSPQLEGKQG